MVSFTMNKIMKTLARAFIAFCYMAALPFFVYANPQTPESQLLLTDEEKIVKLAYMKLKLFNTAANAKASADTQAPRRYEDDIKFEIHDIHTGPIKEILDRPYEKLVTKPSGYVIRFSLATRTVNQGPEEVFYDADWIVSNYVPTALEDWSAPVGQVLQWMGSDYADVEKYTSYEVTVRMAGRERTYRAMVLYHAPLQSDTEPIIDFLDNIVGQSALTEASKEWRPPVRTQPDGGRRKKGNTQMMRDQEGQGNDRERQFNTVAGEMSGSPDENRRDEVSTAGSCPPGTFIDNQYPGGCCDWNTLYCCFPYNPNNGFCDEATCGYPNCTPPPVGGGGGGGGGEGCTASFTEGISSIDNQEDSTDHIIIGYHQKRTVLRGRCDISATCQKKSSVYWDKTEGSFIQYDTGFGLLCHVMDHKQHPEDKTGDAGATSLEGKNTVIIGVKACLFCGCSIQFSWNGLGFNNVGIWSPEHSLSHECHW
jgi:hypothetical protein